MPKTILFPIVATDWNVKHFGCWRRESDVNVCVLGGFADFVGADNTRVGVADAEFSEALAYAGIVWSFTSRLLLGSKDKSTKHESINILTVLKRADQKYPGVMDMYANLSESAHPNFEGICFGYSRVDHEKYETNFSNNWVSMYAEKHVPLMQLCILTFTSEYNDEWSTQFQNLEDWIVANDAALEASKNDPV